MYVVTRDLTFDEEIRDVVGRNLRHSIRYVYFLPDSALTEKQVADFLEELGLDADARRNFEGNCFCAGRGV